jgi:hypothetical protein
MITTKVGFRATTSRSTRLSRFVLRFPPTPALTTSADSVVAGERQKTVTNESKTRVFIAASRNVTFGGGGQNRVRGRAGPQSCRYLPSCQSQSGGWHSQNGCVAQRQDESSCGCDSDCSFQSSLRADDKASCAFGTQPQVVGPPCEKSRDQVNSIKARG